MGDGIAYMSDFGYSYQNNTPTTQPPFTPMMPQPGTPGGGQAWGVGSFAPPLQQEPQSGPLHEDLGTDGFQMPSPLPTGGKVPVTRCPQGGWAFSFVMHDGEFHTIVFVQTQDGMFAPYHLEGLGALRVVPDATAGQEYLMRIPARTGKDLHVLHIPPDGVDGNGKA